MYPMSDSMILALSKERMERYAEDAGPAHPVRRNGFTATLQEWGWVHEPLSRLGQALVRVGTQMENLAAG